MARRPPPKVTARWMRSSATWYLERWPATSGRLRRVMMRKIDRSLAHHGGDRDEAAELLDALIEQLTEGGWLNDERFVKARVEELRRRGGSRRAIRAKLAQQSAPRELVDDALAELQEGSERTAAVAYARRRRLGPFRLDPEQRAERRDKDLAAMARAGFSWSEASTVIDSEDVESLE